MFYSFKNCKILVNNEPIYAQNIDVSWQSKPDASYNIDSKYNKDYRPGDGINGNISLSYYFTGNDQIIDNVINENSPVTISLGGLFINSGYLKKYSFNAIPNTPVVINLDILFFDSLTGNFIPNFQLAPTPICLNIGDAEVSSIAGGNSIGVISNITQLNYEYSVDAKPQYNIGNTIPNRVVFGPKNVNIDFSSDKIDGFVSISGNNVALRTKLVHPTNSGISQNFDCKGVLYQKNLKTSSNNIINSTYFIKQNNLSSFNSQDNQSILKPIIYSIIPATGYYGAIVNISGRNLSFATNVAFTDNTYDGNFQIINDNQIKTVVPFGAISGPITIYSDIGSTISSQIFKIGGLPISISSITPITGRIGSKIIISGNNFYEISNVLFTDNLNSSFTRLNTNLIEATVPNNTAWGKIKVVSSDFGLSGTSSNEFVPIPSIFGFTPGSGLTGENILISGQGFSGITGIKFNNLPLNNTAVFSVTSNSGILVQVPSGNTRGFIRLYGQSGVTSLTSSEFYPYAKITGVAPISGRTGDNVSILGQNFISEILYSFGSNLFAVGFEKEVTGYFKKTNDYTLTGAVPSGAKSGIIHIYSPLQEQYPSNISFNVRNNPPIIDYVSPLSGKYQGLISIIGSNFYNVNSILLTGQNTGQRITSNFSVSNTNDFINFTVPNITGGSYNVFVMAAEGSGSGFFTVLDKPYISGYFPLSGGAGRQVNLSGKNFYNGLTKIYIDNTGVPAAINSGSFSSSNNSIGFFVPSNLSSGLHKIILNNSVDYATGIPDFNYIPNPIISGFNPLSGQWGDNVIVSGLYFNTITGVQLGAIYVNNYTLINSTGLNFSIPVNSATDYISLTNVGGQTFSNDKLIIIPPLIRISGFNPNPTYYGSGLFISGSYLDTAKEIRFSGIISGEVVITNFSNIGTTGISLPTPSAITSGYIKIVNDRGISYSSQLLTIIQDSIINSISIQTGVFKDIVLISGSNLSGSIIYFDALNGSLVRADNINPVNETGVYFNVPSGIVSGPITARGRNQVLASFGNFVVLPTISGISGNQSYPTGQYITITGINVNTNDLISSLGISGNNGFYYDIANPSEFSGTYKTGYSLLNVRLNQNFAGTGKLFLLSENDTDLDFDNFTSSLSYNKRNNIVFNNSVTISQPAPVITSFSPSGGSPSGLLTINGNHLFSTLNVNFNVGASFGLGTITSTGNNRITVIPPSIGITGTGIFYVNTPFGTASSGIFRLLSPLFISGYTPLAAITGSQVRISGASFLSVTGVSFGSHNASFTKINELGTTIITGIVPTSSDCCGETINITVSNEGESFSL